MESSDRTASISAVFLDRDGVLLEAVIRDGRPYPAGSVEEARFVPGAAEAMSRLKGAGFRLILITNQPDIARGQQDRATVEGINRLVSDRFDLNDCFVCYHDDGDQCECRKPRPGLILQAAERHWIDLKRSFVIGDRWRDVDAGYAAGCRTVWIDYGYKERAPAHSPNVRVRNVTEAVDWVLRQTP